jgi:hypothetical protein
MDLFAEHIPNNPMNTKKTTARTLWLAMGMFFNPINLVLK